MNDGIFLCTISSCERQPVARGMCRAHARRPVGAVALPALPTCRVSGCIDDAYYGDGWFCGAHWRAEVDGRPFRAKPGWEPLQQFDLYVRRNLITGCWEWTGTTADGYGKVWGWDGGTLAHRFAYEMHYGPIPDGLVIDHLCRNRACVNPTHLEAITQEENVRRGAAPGQRLWVPAPSCSRGHAFTEENTYRPPGHPTHRHCRTCKREAAHQRRTHA